MQASTSTLGSGVNKASGMEDVSKASPLGGATVMSFGSNASLLHEADTFMHGIKLLRDEKLLLLFRDLKKF